MTKKNGVTIANQQPWNILNFSIAHNPCCEDLIASLFVISISIGMNHEIICIMACPQPLVLRI